MISIIVPVYNSSGYLRTCIDSILSQSYKNWELILVDDGSKDLSGAICDDYAVEDSRIVAIHIENSGVSAARNVGLDMAKGDWVTFIDSDDYIFPCFLNNLLKAKDYDLVAGGVKFSTGWNHIPHELFVKKEEMRCHMEQIIGDGFFYSVWGKLYKRSIINDNNIRFDRSMKLGEDGYFVSCYVAQCQSISLVPFSDYYYNCPSQVRKYELTIDELNYHNALLKDGRDRMHNTFGYFIDDRHYDCLLYALRDLYIDYTDKFCLDYIRLYYDGLLSSSLQANVLKTLFKNGVKIVVENIKENKILEAKTQIRRMRHFCQLPLSKYKGLTTSSNILFFLIRLNLVSIVFVLLYLLKNRK